MADPRNDLALTYGDMQAIAAREMGDETVDPDTGRLIPPEDVYSVGRAKRVVQSALRRVVSEGPREGWEFKRQIVTLSLSATAGSGNVGGDAARLRMPWFFTGQCNDDWAYEDEGGLVLPLRRVPAPRFNEMRAPDPDQTADPYIVTFRPIQETPLLSGRGWEAVFYPTPSTSRTVTVSVDAQFGGMVNDDDAFLAGGEHYARMIDAAIKLESALEIRSEYIEERRGDWQTALGYAIGRQRESRPKAAGILSDTIRNPLKRGATAHHPDPVSFTVQGQTSF